MEQGTLTFFKTMVVTTNHQYTGTFSVTLVKPGNERRDILPLMLRVIRMFLLPTLLVWSHTNTTHEKSRL